MEVVWLALCCRSSQKYVLRMIVGVGWKRLAIRTPRILFTGIVNCWYILEVIPKLSKE